MSRRIDPIGPQDRRVTGVPRVQRRERAPEERDPADENEAFEEQLERNQRQRQNQRHRREPPPPPPPPPAAVDLSFEAGGSPPVRPLVPPRSQHNEGDDGLPHIDVSV